MKKYHFIVIGTGCGSIISSEAAAHGYKVAVIDKGPLIGGTCLNLGCIPSKMLIYVADRTVEIQESGKLGIRAEIKDINFASIMERMRKGRAESQVRMREASATTENLDFYEGEGHFVSDYVIEVNGERIQGENIYIASGSRPLIPPIKGLEGVDYLTNETLLELTQKPDGLIIIGGGYVAVEYGHFFAAMGVKVTILEMADRLVLAEEPEISELLKEKLSKRMAVHTGAQAEQVKRTAKGVTVVVTDKATGKPMEFSAQKLLVAVGRRSNADLLKVENLGVEIDARGFIKVNEYLETSKKSIFAVGDANGQQMFTHVANRQAALAVENALHGAQLKMDYSAIPHAVYSYPQIAAVGLREAEARKQHDVVVGVTKYYDVAKGEAMIEKEGFAKAIVEKETGKILGFHIIGPMAPELIQEVTNAMTSGGNRQELNNGIHIHPALSELIPTAVNSVEET